MAKADESFLGQVLAAGIAKLSAGYDRAVKAMEEVGEEENMKLEHRLGYMALIGSVAPMLGLFGTVDGMIAAFMVIATSNTTPKPSELADGVSTALVTTYVGLAIAIPAITVFNILKSRFARMMLDVAIQSENLMSRFENVAPAEVEPAMKHPKPDTTIVEGDMTPMIDCVFQLMAFFLFALNFTQADQNERIQLPESELAKPPEGVLAFPITLHVTKENTVIIGGEEVGIGGLAPTCRAKPTCCRSRAAPCPTPR